VEISTCRCTNVSPFISLNLRIRTLSDLTLIIKETNKAERSWLLLRLRSGHICIAAAATQQQQQHQHSSNISTAATATATQTM